MTESTLTFSGTTIEGLSWQVLQGDALRSLKHLDSSSVNCVVTSPPYFWLRDYGVDGQIGNEDSVEGYVDRIANIMDEVYRVLLPQGTLFLNLGDTYYSGKGKSHGHDRKSKKRRFGLRAVDKSGGLGIGLQRKSAIGIPWRVALEMCSRNWVLRSPIIWHRDKCLPESVVDRPRRSYEFVFFFVKNRKYFFDRQPLIDQSVDEDVWTIPPYSQNGYVDTAPFPEALVERCLSIGCPASGLVLDPFAGSGTTARTALRTGRPSVSIELNPDFVQYILHSLKGDSTS